jgi:hypothetical protein
MTSDVLERCSRCGEDERRVEVRDDDRGRWWSIVCSPSCPAAWRLIVADAKPEPEPRSEIERLSRSVLSTQARLLQIEDQFHRLKAALA